MKDRRMYTVFALMLATFLTAVDTTVVETAMPRIVGSLGGFALLTWLVTAFMLTSTAAVPVYGKLADLYGRKRIFTIGTLIFLTGSALCGAAQSMEQLILFRGVQGLGAGAVQPVVQTIIGDIFTPEERAHTQGWFSAVWGFSALTGPLVGGLIVDFANWRWLFYINLPLGALALLMIWRFLDETVEPRKVQVDYLGSITMTVGITMLMLALLSGGTRVPWSSPQIVWLLAGAAALLGVFVWQEQRAPDPMLPLDIFRNPMIGLSVLSSFMIGGVLYGISVYLPLWAQGVQGFSATRSGASLLWISIGWPLSSVLGAKLVVRLGVRPAAVLGLSLNALASTLLVIFGRVLPFIPEPLLALVTFIIGSGMGFSQLAFILGVQNAVEWSQRGVATASLQFLRTLGGLVWVAVMGGVMNMTLFSGLRRIPGLGVTSSGEAGDMANRLLDPEARTLLPAESVQAMQEALAAALRNVHLLILLAALVGLVVALMLPRQRLQDQQTTAKPVTAEE